MRPSCEFTPFRTEFDHRTVGLVAHDLRPSRVCASESTNPPSPNPPRATVSWSMTNAPVPPPRRAPVGAASSSVEPQERSPTGTRWMDESRGPDGWRAVARAYDRLGAAGARQSPRSNGSAGRSGGRPRSWRHHGHIEEITARTTVTSLRSLIQARYAYTSLTGVRDGMRGTGFDPDQDVLAHAVRSVRGTGFEPADPYGTAS
jgi:hypothetical protein